MKIALALIVISTCYAAELCAQQAGSSFRAVDIFVDSGNQPLAAYQLTFRSTNRSVKIVGIEGGEHNAFAEPPYYDPQAMQNDHVIIAAFSTSTADQLPHGRTRIATIHVRAESGHAPAYNLQVNAAATADGKRISVKVNLEERTAR
jgi:hypothetical protein